MFHTLHFNIGQPDGLAKEIKFIISLEFVKKGDLDSLSFSYFESAKITIYSLLLVQGFKK
jgi:hypothetical protein